MQTIELRENINRELENFPKNLLEEVFDFVDYIKEKKLKKDEIVRELEKIDSYKSLNSEAKKEAYEIVKGVEDGLNDIKKGNCYPIDKLWEKVNDWVFW